MDADNKQRWLTRAGSPATHAVPVCGVPVRQGRHQWRLGHGVIHSAQLYVHCPGRCEQQQHHVGVKCDRASSCVCGCVCGHAAGGFCCVLRHEVSRLSVQRGGFLEWEITFVLDVLYLLKTTTTTLTQQQQQQQHTYTHTHTTTNSGRLLCHSRPTHAVQHHRLADTVLQARCALALLLHRCCVCAAEWHVGDPWRV